MITLTCMTTIFKCIVGSQAYGTNIATSDVDYKGVYIQPLQEVLGWSYKDQINVTKDETYYELKRFLELASSANPTMLELLFMPDNMIIHSTPEWEYIRENRHLFLTKRCVNSFGGYGLQQIKKAKGLNKKMNWETSRVERKEVIDFCYIGVNGKSVRLTHYLKAEKILPEFCGMVKLDHMADCYGMYHDTVSQWAGEANHRFKQSGEVPTLGFKGVQSDDGNQLLLSSIPKHSIACEGVVYFNKSEWSSHCADYESYLTWVKERNEQRYIDTQVHGQKIDGKNLMHCVRLIDMALEIAHTGDLTIFRHNHAYLLDIRAGKYDLNHILHYAEKNIAMLDEAFAKSKLPDTISTEKVEHILYKLRGV